MLNGKLLGSVSSFNRVTENRKGCLTTPGLTKPIRTPSWLLLRAALPMMNWGRSAPWLPMFRETPGIVIPKPTLFYSTLECFETINAGLVCRVRTDNSGRYWVANHWRHPDTDWYYFCSSGVSVGSPCVLPFFNFPLTRAFMKDLIVILSSNLLVAVSVEKGELLSLESVIGDTAMPGW